MEMPEKSERRKPQRYDKGWHGVALHHFEMQLKNNLNSTD
jgi:hypothetical protein